MKTNFSIRLLFTGLWIHGFCAASVAVETPGIVRLYGYTFGYAGVSFQVASSGGTSKPSFELRRSGTEPVHLLLVRVKEEPFREEIPWGTTITYSWDELGVTSNKDYFIIDNDLFKKVSPFIATERLPTP